MHQATADVKCQPKGQRGAKNETQTNELRYTFCSVTKAKKESKKRHRRKEEKKSGAAISAGWRAVKSKILLP
jgi:hypothetical protein